MNIEKIFKALEEDSDNSPMGVICRQLEHQGYFVTINGKLVSSAGIFEGEYRDLESLSQVDISLMKGKRAEQEFSIEFTDIREIIIKKKEG